jgi:hypothetical protein
MAHEAHGEILSEMTTATLPTVRVDRAQTGVWEVVLPDQADHLKCPSLNEARRIARLQAARLRPCELVICDAYHRVAARETLTAD